MPNIRKFQAGIAAIAIWLAGSAAAMAEPARPDVTPAPAERVVTLGKVTLTPDLARRGKSVV